MKNGVLVLSSVTGGERTVEVNADRLTFGFVLCEVSSDRGAR